MERTGFRDSDWRWPTVFDVFGVLLLLLVWWRLAQLRRCCRGPAFRACRRDSARAAHDRGRRCRTGAPDGHSERLSTLGRPVSLARPGRGSSYGLRRGDHRRYDDRDALLASAKRPPARTPHPHRGSEPTPSPQPRARHSHRPGPERPAASPDGRSGPSSPTSNRPAACAGTRPNGAASTPSTSTGCSGTRRKPALSSAISLNSLAQPPKTASVSVYEEFSAAVSQPRSTAVHHLPARQATWVSSARPNSRA